MPRKALAGEAGTTKTTTIDRPAENLKPVTISTREILLGAVNKRFRDKRYNEMVVSDPPRGCVFEMAACMSPCFVQLMWMSAVCSSEKEAQHVGKFITGSRTRLNAAYAKMVLFLNTGTRSTPPKRCPLCQLNKRCRWPPSGFPTRVQKLRAFLWRTRSRTTTWTSTQSRCRAELGRSRIVIDSRFGSCFIFYLPLIVSFLFLSSLLAIFVFVFIRRTSCKVFFSKLKLLIAVFSTIRSSE